MLGFGNIRRFLRADSGVTAIEFAIIAPLLVLLLFGTIEMGRLLWVRAVFSHAISETARLVQVPVAEVTAAALEAAMIDTLTESGYPDVTVFAETIDETSGISWRLVVTNSVALNVPFFDLAAVTLRVETVAFPGSLE